MSALAQVDFHVGLLGADGFFFTCSNGDPTWSAGPPASDSIMKIQRIEMYYNRTGSLGTC